MTKRVNNERSHDPIKGEISYKITHDPIKGEISYM